MPITSISVMLPSGATISVMVKVDAKEFVVSGTSVEPMRLTYEAAHALKQILNTILA